MEDACVRGATNPVRKTRRKTFVNLILFQVSDPKVGYRGVFRQQTRNGKERFGRKSRVMAVAVRLAQRALWSFGSGVVFSVF